MGQKYAVIRNMLYGIAKPGIASGSMPEVQGICNDIAQLLELHQQRFDNRPYTWKKSRYGRCEARILYRLFSGLAIIERNLHGDGTHYSRF